MRGSGSLAYGIRANLVQFLHQLLQVLLVGLTIGTMRTVLPAVAESEFGVARNSFTLLASFVVAFGIVKAVLNLVAGRFSDRVGRKRVLLWGWISAIPIPFMILWGASWNWIVAATVLLGVNQGLTWSMTQTAKLDITRPDQRGLTIGLNEFAGYLGVAAAGVMTGYLAEAFGAREGLALFGGLVIGCALLLTWRWVEDTSPWARAQAPTGALDERQEMAGRGVDPTTWEVFRLVSWRDRRLFALSQAGLVEKFVDALVWVMVPVFLVRRGVSITGIGWIVGVYGFVWGSLQLATGRLSDRVGRHVLNVSGMWLCGAGVGLMPVAEGAAWWSLCAALSGVGMALLYPNLSAAVVDIVHPRWRGSAIGIYRFWRDLGYGVGALAIGLLASATGAPEGAFWLVAAAMLASGTILWLLGEETRPQPKIA